MRQLLFEFNDLKIWKENNLHFAVYDAGTHQVLMRKDEISEDEAMFAIQGKEHAIKMLFDLQKRLIASGIDPYVSNVNELY